jgi:hypothetical protein
MDSEHDKAVADVMGTSPGKPLLIGRKEYVYFPEWGHCRVKVKVDTGARTSAIDAISYQLLETPDRGQIVELRLAVDARHPERERVVRAPMLRRVMVSNSNGMRELRPVIEAELRLGPVTKRVQLTVTNRAGMLFRMILGRKALEGDFVVDVSKKYLLRAWKG